MKNPVFRLETTRQRRNRGLRFLNMGCLPAILSVTGLAIVGVLGFTFIEQSWDLENAVISALGMALVLMVLIQASVGSAANILMVAQTALSISGELELKSWGLLRTTTLPLREIVLAKFTAALYHLRHSLLGLLILRLVSAGTGLLLMSYYLFREFFYYMGPDQLKSVVALRLWVGPTVVIVVFLVWYVSQPVVQYLLNAALGMLVSSMARSRARAIVTGLAGRFVGWIVSIVLNVAFLYGLGFLFQNWTGPAYAPIAAFRSLPTPTVQQTNFAVSLTATLYVLGVSAFQVGLIVVLLRLAQHRARRLGA